MPQRVRRFYERALYYMENPKYGQKRLGRAVGLVPPPKRLVVTNHH